MRNIVFHDKTKTFHLYNEKISYIMCVLENGHMGQIYFGKKIHDKEDFSYLVEKIERPMTSYIYEWDKSFSLEHIRQEYPVYGTTDYRHPAIELLQKNGSRISEFKYTGYEITMGKPKLQGLPAIYAESEEEAVTLRIYLRDSLTGIILELLYTIFSEYGAIARSVCIKNAGKMPLHLLTAMSLNLDLPDKDYIWMLKAETDAEYHHIVGNDLLKKLNPKDRSYIEYRCVYGRIELFHHINPAEYVRLCNALIIHAQKDYPIEDRRIFQMILDVAITGKNVQSYEDLRKQYPQEYFQDAENMGFVDELYGNMEAAYKKFSKMFEEHKDYDGSFRIMKGFLIRNKKRKEYNHLYDQLMADPPDISYEQPQFYADRVREELLDWNDKFKAMELYTFYYDQIKGDMTLAKELEEAIKINIADYSGYEERIAWNRYMLTKAPQYAKIQIYDTILKLYVANMKYKEAVAVVEEMQQLKIPFMSRFNQCTMVCARPQRSSFYVGWGGKIRASFSSDKNFIAGLLNRAHLNYWYRMPGLNAIGMEIIVPMRTIICIFRENRQKELLVIKRIHIMYSGIIGLQDSLWREESSFLRMILQWLEKADNVVVAAPDFMFACKEMKGDNMINDCAEEVQINLYAKEHQDYICLK